MTPHNGQRNGFSVNIKSLRTWNCNMDQLLTYDSVTNASLFTGFTLLCSHKSICWAVRRGAVSDSMKKPVYICVCVCGGREGGGGGSINIIHSTIITKNNMWPLAHWCKNNLLMITVSCSSSSESWLSCCVALEVAQHYQTCKVQNVERQIQTNAAYMMREHTSLWSSMQL